MSEKKRKTGRPKIPMTTEDLGDLSDKLPSRKIDLRQVLYWMDLGATAEEIAGAHYVSVRTLDRRLQEETGMSFVELKEKCCGAVKTKLRHNQFKMSEHNASMAIWLGKQWLGQSDRIDNLEEQMKTVLSVLNNVNQFVDQNNSTDSEAT